MVVELYTPGVLIPNKTLALPAFIADTHPPHPPRSPFQFAW